MLWRTYTIFTFLMLSAFSRFSVCFTFRIALTRPTWVTPCCGDCTAAVFVAVAEADEAIAGAAPKPRVPATSAAAIHLFILLMGFPFLLQGVRSNRALLLRRHLPTVLAYPHRFRGNDPNLDIRAAHRPKREH